MWTPAHSPSWRPRVLCLRAEGSPGPPETELKDAGRREAPRLVGLAACSGGSVGGAGRNRMSASSRAAAVKRAPCLFGCSGRWMSYKLNNGLPTVLARVWGKGTPRACGGYCEAARPRNIKNRTAVRLSDPASGYLPEEVQNTSLRRYKRSYVHFGIIRNSRDVEATQVSVNK